jgi:hypothetical protein
MIQANLPLAHVKLLQNPHDQIKLTQELNRNELLFKHIQLLQFPIIIGQTSMKRNTLVIQVMKTNAVATRAIQNHPQLIQKKHRKMKMTKTKSLQNPVASINTARWYAHSGILN